MMMDKTRILPDVEVCMYDPLLVTHYDAVLPHKVWWDKCYGSARKEDVNLCYKGSLLILSSLLVSTGSVFV